MKPGSPLSAQASPSGDGFAGQAPWSEQLFDDISRRCLADLGVEAGWRCLEVGAGDGAIARWLAQRVATSGEVVVTDADPALLHMQPVPDNLEIRAIDFADAAIEVAAYDLVHARERLGRSSRPLAALRELAAAVRPGGWLCVEEYDFSAFGALDDAQSGAPGFEHDTRACLDALRTQGVLDTRCGRHLPGLLRELHFAKTGLSARVLIGEGGEHPLGRWCASMFRSPALDGLVERGVLAGESVARVQALVDTPGLGLMGPVLVSAWGQRPFFGDV